MPTLTKPRRRKDITIREDLFLWCKEQIAKGKFWNFSHVVEQALILLKKSRSES